MKTLILLSMEPERIKVFIKKTRGDTTKNRFFFFVNGFHNIFLCMAWEKLYH